MTTKAGFSAKSLMSYIQPDLTHFAETHYNGDQRKAFRHWTFKQIFVDGEFDDSAVMEKTRIDRTKDLEVDGWWSDEENRVIRLFQAKNEAGLLRVADLDKFLAAPDKLETPELVEHGNEHVKALAYEYKQRREEE